MNKSIHIIFLCAALLAASLASYVVYKKITSRSAIASTPSKQNILKIAVALNDLKRGCKITEQDLRLASYLKDSIPKGHFINMSDAVGRIVLKNISATEPVLESSLAPTDITKGGMAAIIQHQKRAMAVKVDDVVGVAGFLQPGHLVDVLVTLTRAGEKRTCMTKTVLEKIPVLSIGTQAQESDEKKAKRVTVVTLEVDLEEGEKLALAMNEGKIQLALRSYTDNDQIFTRGTNIPSLLKSYATALNDPIVISPNATKQARAPQVSKLVIEVMNGNNVKRLTMDSH